MTDRCVVVTLREDKEFLMIGCGSDRAMIEISRGKGKRSKVVVHAPDAVEVFRRRKEQAVKERWIYAEVGREQWDLLLKGHDDVEWFSDEARTVLATCEEWEAAHLDIHSDRGQMMDPSEFPAVVRRRIG